MKNNYKEIFIFIAGATPQVITETIYALTTQNRPVYPDEIYVITTNRSRQMMRVLSKNILKKLEEEFNLPRLNLHRCIL